MFRKLVLLLSTFASAQLLAGTAALAPEDDQFLSFLERNVASGGPPKDGIPAIEKPQYTSAAEADKWLTPGDVIFIIEYKGLVAAYPQRILVWHEIANETAATKESRSAIVR